MMRLISAGLLLWLAGSAVFASPDRRGATAVQIADALVSRDPAANNRGLEELAAADAQTCEELGHEINRRGAREADTILTAIGQCQTPNALVAAFVALENECGVVRSAALDAVLAVPFSVSAQCGEQNLKGSRRKRLFELLTSPDELADRCEAIRLDGTPTVDDVNRLAINLSLLADRFYGSPGFVGSLRALAKVMVGSDVPYPPEIGARPIRYPGETLTSFAKRDRQWSERKAERDRKMEDFNRALRRRQAAEALFRCIWVADLTPFNYVSVAGYGDREAAVARVLKRLDEMEAQKLTLGARVFQGMRVGDHLMDLWGSDVSEFKAAAYLRLRAMSGEPIELHGDGYGEAIAEFNALSRRQLAELRKKLKDWWTQYREQTEPR